MKDVDRQIGRNRAEYKKSLLWENNHNGSISNKNIRLEIGESIDNCKVVWVLSTIWTAVGKKVTRAVPSTPAVKMKKVVALKDH